MNHLEELTKEWLEYRGYFVRQSVLVGPRTKGGYEGELDIVALNPVTRHLLHIECSLDALAWDKRELRFAAKFELICPLLSGPISILELVTKEEWNGEEAQAGRDHRQAA